MVIHNGNIENLKELKVDCGKCSGLCCTALFFSKIDGFPENKVAGTPCSKLQKDFRCKIHSELNKRNMKGCIGYDCFGAGQYVTKEIYNGETWQSLKDKSTEIFEVFLIIFQLYQIRFYLEESRTITTANRLWNDIDKLVEENKALCSLSIEDILKIDVDRYRDKANMILKEVSLLIKESSSNKNHREIHEFFGRNFSKKDLSGLDLSMKLLIAANFNGCKFHGTNFLGADTRDTDFSNADLREAVFITQGQINSAKGNMNTKIPKYLDYPVTWK